MTIKLTEKQKLELFTLLQSTLNMNIQGYLCYDHETRVKMIQDIINQQSDKLTEKQKLE